LKKRRTARAPNALKTRVEAMEEGRLCEIEVQDEMGRRGRGWNAKKRRCKVPM
jgi:hypothetical protein